MNWEYGVDLSELCTPIGECVCIAVGSIDPTIVGRLESSRYDQAPVTDRGSVVGLIETGRARSLLESGSQLKSSDQAITHPEITRRVSIEFLLDSMSKMSTVFVIEESDAERCGVYTNCVGLLTVADLNRHALRATFYRVLARLEAEMARLVEHHFADPWTWLQILPDNHQVNLVGYWELTKRRGVDIGPTAGATLTELLRVIEACRELRLALGFRSASSFGELAGRIPQLRNTVMHPVRPLFPGIEHVSRVSATLRAAIDLGAKVESLNNLKVGTMNAR